MSRLVLKSPAKINLFLKVLNKRNDGFHNIETLFQRVDLCDQITFQTNSSGNIKISSDHRDVPCGKKNLVYQVYALLKKEHKAVKGVDVKIDKFIPVAAGMAGGSSNAASALIGFNKIFDLGLSSAQLLAYARMLGSDIAFFLYDTNWAVGTGKGDQIRPLDIGVKLWQVVVVPCVKVYSAEVYKAHNLQLTKRNDDVNILIYNLKKKDINAVGSLLQNDLEDAIIRICPKLLRLKEALKLFDTQGVMISGSGPSVFGLTRSQCEAQKTATEMLKRYTRVYVVRTR